MAKHTALEVFIGNWTSEGTNYNGDKKSPWHGLNTTRWHSGEQFLIQDEHANGPFDTHAVMGWDDEGQRYFARTVENHGFCRDYTLTVSDKVWTFTGKTERARYEFNADHTEQMIKWERNVDGKWVPLCDRIAKKV
jgi:hypothetical protein